MALLQPRLNLKIAQKQVLTPGLVQMVNLLALNKQELKEMIDAEIMENPVLEELDEAVPILDEVRAPDEKPATLESVSPENDPFNEIDFGSYFQDYLDPGYRTPQSTEINERPSFENFLSKPTTLTDHLMWQLGSISLPAPVRDAAELIIGNLDEDGYLTASDEELLAALHKGMPSPWPMRLDSLAAASDAASHHASHDVADRSQDHSAANFRNHAAALGSNSNASNGTANGAGQPSIHSSIQSSLHSSLQSQPSLDASAQPSLADYPASLRRDLAQALEVVRHMDPVGVAARDLRECLLMQLDARLRDAANLAASLTRETAASRNAGNAAEQEPPMKSAEDGKPALALECAHSEDDAVIALARRIIDCFLPYLLKRDVRELARLTGSHQTRVQRAIETIRGLDPKPGQKYNREQARLIEPDVAFAKRDDEYVILINDEEMPTLRLNQGYRRMLTQEGTEREVRDYVKERYRSAVQLMRNIEQRKNTILRTCEVIVRRQRDFMEHGVDALKPMMIKDVAEEIGVHASTVSRAVANKYAHTPQGVFELRFFFSEGVNGPEGSDTPLLLLKRKVKKMIEEEDPRKPLTDDAIASLLQASGIAVNRRTVAKYREDMGIPSTHQRRVRI